MTKTNVSPFPGATSPLQLVPEVVSQLEALLARAKTGEIREIAIAAVTDQKCISTAWHHENDYFRLVGAVSWLSRRLTDD